MGTLWRTPLFRSLRTRAGNGEDLYEVSHYKMGRRTTMRFSLHGAHWSVILPTVVLRIRIIFLYETDWAWVDDLGVNVYRRDRQPPHYKTTVLAI